MEVFRRPSFYFYKVSMRSEDVHPISSLSLSSSSSSASSSPAKISFRFVKCTTECIFNPEARTFVGPIENPDNLPVILPDLSVRSEIVEIGNEEFYRCVSESLESLALDVGTPPTLVASIITKTSRLKQEHSVSHPNFRVLPLTVQITRVDFLLVREPSTSSGIRIIEELTEAQTRHGMVPASEKAIKKMLKTVTATGIDVQEESEVKECAGDCKRRRISGNRKAETCMICLEEIRVGSVATQVPCSHVFHTECVNNWLRISHYCPLCRFEFPIEDTD